MRILWLFLSFFCATSVKSLASYRLPGNVKPTHYIIQVLTELEEPNPGFSGAVWIKVECLTPTNSIILHSRQLNIKDKATTVKEIVSKDELTLIPVTSVTEDKENEFLIINLDQNLKKGAIYIIHIPFVGELLGDLHGYYKSSYVDKKTNTTRWLAVTDFEPTDARKAFPCFDEPDKKAIFIVKLAHKKHLKAISNMPLTKTIPHTQKEGYIWSFFQGSVPMSTYLVAYMVSDFEFNEAPPRSNNVIFRIWSRKDAISQTDFAKEVGPKALEFFEGFFDLKYPLPKQDMVAVPDFSAGGMENWGLITYRESHILYDPEATSQWYKRYIAYLIAHELAHQWYGNLVTMKWWSDLWLKEGFATYIGTLGIEKLFPNWEYLSETTLDHANYVFELDSLVSSHPVSKEIGHPSEISQMFDTISYKKGAFILRMMHLFLGDSLHRALNKYLRKYQYANADQNDLWAVLTEQAHADGTLDKSLTVKEVMDTWTLQTGYPLVTVTRDYAKGTAKLTQEIYNVVKPSGQNKDACWWIPITYTTQDSPNFKNTLPKLWMNSKNRNTAELTKLDAKSWLLLNIDIAGLYRVKYDDQNWKMLSDALNSDKFTEISVLNRADLLMTAFDLSWTADLTYNQALPLIRYLEKEKEWLPWKVASAKLMALNRILRRTASYFNFKDFVTRLITPIYQQGGRLTDVPKEYDKLQLRNEIFRWALDLEMEDAIKQVKELFAKWMATNDPDNNNPIQNDLRSWVYCNAVWFGGKETWDFMFERYINSQGGSEKSFRLVALGCSRDTVILKRCLQWTITPGSPIRIQDNTVIFASVLRNKNGFSVINEYLQYKINDINTRNSERLGFYLELFADYIVYDDELNKLKGTISANNQYLRLATLKADQSIEKAQANSNWFKTNYQNLANLLKSK